MTDPPPTPFMGCCESDPCSSTSGCPADSLAAMFLSKNADEANRFDPQPPLAGSVSTQSSSSSTTMSTSTSVLSSTSTLASTTTGTAAAASTSAGSREEHHSTPIGAIVGGAVGGFALICAIALIVWRVKYHSKRSSKKHREESALHDRPAQDQNNADSNGQEKLTAAGVIPMHSPYQGKQYSPSFGPQDPQKANSIRFTIDDAARFAPISHAELEPQDATRIQSTCSYSGSRKSFSLPRILAASWDLLALQPPTAVHSAYPTSEQSRAFLQLGQQ